MTERPRGMGARRRLRGTPAVVFLDDLRWDAFTQLSPRLRRAGVRTIRLSTETHLRSRLTSRLLFDRHAVLAEGAETTVLAEILADEHVVDLQFVETLSDIVRANLALLDPAVADAVTRRLAVMDKFVAAKAFAEAGVATPAVVPVHDSSPAEIVAEFGLPVVAKRRVGCGGDNVVIAGDLDALEAAASRWAGDADARYYERFVDGVKLNYAAAVSERGIEQEMAYRVSRWMMPVGTATQIETIDDPALMAFGRRAVEVSGCTGLMNLDVMRDADGHDWLIDFNARAFGGGANFLSVGMDISEGYLISIGSRADPPSTRVPPTAAHIDVFPTSLGDDRHQRKVLRMTTAFLSESWPYLRWLGLRYWLSELLRAPDAAAAARRGRTPGRRAAADPS